jgi:hypothetical protein
MRRTGTRRTKPAALAAEGQQHLMLAGVTAQPHKAVREDAALQIVIKFTLDIGRQTGHVSDLHLDIQSEPKLVPIDEQPNDDVIHLKRLDGKRHTRAAGTPALR